MYDEDDFLPISAIQHLAFCARQCALIHLERVWEENRLTAEGRVLHDHAHERGREVRDRVMTVHALGLRSLELGLVGQADVVEFRPCQDDDEQRCTPIPGRRGLWRPFPVEYKRGRPKPQPIDEVQLCCQALCLEEMLDTTVAAGAIYYGTERRRLDVVFTDELKIRARELAVRLHGLISSRTLPAAEPGPKCRNCSLAGHCLPRVVNGGKRVTRYMATVFADRPFGGDDA